MDPSSSLRQKKRQRKDSSASNHDTNADDPFPPLDLKPFSCTRKLKDMDPTNLTDYFPQLPERTQFFDMGKIVDVDLREKPYYTDDMLVWREIRPWAEVAFEYHCNPPLSINEHSKTLPLSDTKMALRGAATYHDLLCRVNSRLPHGQEWMERLSLAIAKKTMDYVLISYTLCSPEKMNFYLPDHREWFEIAQITIQKWTNTLPQLATRSISSPRTNDRIGNNDGLDYEKIVDSMILLPPVGSVKEAWDSIFGNKDAKQSMYTAMRLDPLRQYSRVNNIVLFGPPGTGKTMTWKAAAGFTGWTTFDATRYKIQQPYFGQSEKVITTLFRHARERQPACIVIDESDWILSQRTPHESDRAQSIRCAFRKNMSDAMHENLKIMVIATTNRAAEIDEGFMSRFHMFIYIGLPDRGTILKILKAQLAVYDQDKDVTNENLDELATQMAAKRTLSGGDVTRAVAEELKLMLEEPWHRASHFREETDESGEKTLVPCKRTDEGAFKCGIDDLTDAQVKQLKTRKVRLADVDKVLKITRAVTSATKLEEYENFNKHKGSWMA